MDVKNQLIAISCNKEHVRRHGGASFARTQGDNFKANKFTTLCRLKKVESLRRGRLSTGYVCGHERFVISDRLEEDPYDRGRRGESRLRAFPAAVL